MSTLIWLPIGIAFTFLLYCSLPLIVANTRKKPISISRLKWKCALLIAVVFIPFSALMFISSDGTYWGNTAAPFIWGLVAYRLMKKKLHKRGLLIKPEDPVFVPAPPVEAVDYSATLSEYTFIVPGEKKSSLQEPSANTVPAQPQVVGVQANVRGPIVTPVSASEPVPQEVVSNKHTGLKVFSVIITLLFIASAAYAVMLHFNLRTANAEIHRLETANVALKKDAENARAAQISAEKNLEKMRSEHLELTLSELTQRLMLKQIGYIYEGYRNYHAYPKCSIVAAADTYTAHNTNYCEYLGYDPCPLCWDN